MGSIHSRVVQREPPSVGIDVVIVMSESSSMVSFHHWLPSTIRILDNALLESNIGTDPLVPNRYALVGFGRSALPNGSDIFTRPHAFTADGETFVNIDKFAQLGSHLKASGNGGDGFLAIEYALKNLTDDNGENLLRIGRSGVTIIVIFFMYEDRNVVASGGGVTLGQEDRDDLTLSRSSITRSGIKRTLKRAGAVLNVVVDQQFYGEFDYRALGYTNQMAYFVEPFGEYRTTYARCGVRVGNGDTTRDYVSVALETYGAAWDIGILGIAGAVATSFTRALVEVLSSKARRPPIDSCRRCRCIDFGLVSRLSCRSATDQERCKRDYKAVIIDTG